MRNAATGFILGYAVVALLIAPMLVWTCGVARSYADGVGIVLNRMDMLRPLQRGVRQAVEFGDHTMSVVDDFLNRQVVQYLRPQRN